MNDKDDANHLYEYGVDLDGDSAPARVIRLVASGSKVLEVGAGPGSITRHLSGMKNCDVVALEVDQTALLKLRPHARRVVSADLNDAAWIDMLAGETDFDFVIAADVLEHVYQPLAVLKAMKGFLRPGGSVILSLPHVGHSGVASCLYDQDFDYRDWGLLDRTHIRFFGIKNMTRLYADAGLAIAEAQFVVRRPDETEFAERWSRMPDDLRRVLTGNPFGNVYQVVSRAMAVEHVQNPVDLISLPIEDREFPAPVPEPVPVPKTLLHAWARQNLGPESRRRLRSMFARAGIRL